MNPFVGLGLVSNKYSLTLVVCGEMGLKIRMRKICDINYFFKRLGTAGLKPMVYSQGRKEDSLQSLIHVQQTSMIHDNIVSHRIFPSTL